MIYARRRLALPVAGVAELVDARDLESRDESRGGSNPSARTSRAVSPELRPRTSAQNLGGYAGNGEIFWSARWAVKSSADGSNRNCRCGVKARISRRRARYRSR